MPRVYNYKGSSGRLAVVATKHSATAGLLWLLNPVGSTKTIKIKKIKLKAFPVDTTAFVSAPRITAERMTFTGVCSATVITPAKKNSSEPTQTAKLVAATTGATPTAGAQFATFVVPPTVTAVGIPAEIEQTYDPKDKDCITLQAGEGIVLRQADDGTTSDTRIAVADIDWDEY